LADSSSISNLRIVRKEIREVSGRTSRSVCGCLFKRVRGWRFRGVILGGDVLVSHCRQHAAEAATADDVEQAMEQNCRKLRGKGISS
jgi:hypothetical protein